MLATGRRCPLGGLYQTTCGCVELQEVAAGSPFPSCGSCAEPVCWTFLQPRARGLVLATPAETREVEAHVARLRACLEHGASAAPLRFALGRSLLRLGQIERGLGVLLDVIDRGGVSLAAHLEAARTLIAVRRHSAAEEALRRASEIAEKEGDLQTAVDLEPLLEIARTRPALRGGRQAERVPLASVLSRADGLPPGRYVGVNISETGACVSSAIAASPGEFVPLDFSVAEEPMGVHAQVVWCRCLGRSDDPFSVGLQFLGAPRRVIQRVRDYVLAARSRGPGQEPNQGGEACPSRSTRS